MHNKYRNRPSDLSAEINLHSTVSKSTTMQRQMCILIYSQKRICFNNHTKTEAEHITKYRTKLLPYKIKYINCPFIYTYCYYSSHVIHTKMKLYFLQLCYELT